MRSVVYVRQLPRALEAAAHCSTLQYTATHCNTLQHTTAHCNTLQHTTAHCNTLQYTATHCNTLQHTAAHCNTLQHPATHLTHICHTSTLGGQNERFHGCLCAAVASHSGGYNTMQHTATHCNTLQHSATRCNTLTYLSHISALGKWNEQCQRMRRLFMCGSCLALKFTRSMMSSAMCTWQHALQHLLQSNVGSLHLVCLCCGVLQCVAVCCSPNVGSLHLVCLCFSVFQCGAVCCSVLQCVAVQRWLANIWCAYVSVCLGVYVSVPLYGCVATWLCGGVCVCVSFCLSVCLSVCVCVCVCVSIYLCFCVTV